MAGYEHNIYTPNDEISFVFGNGEHGSATFSADNLGKMVVRRTAQPAPEPQLQTDEHYFTEVLEPMAFGD